MAINGIQGKPGSGKSCYAIDMIVKELMEWAIYKKRTGRNFDRTLLTNIPVKVENLMAHLSAELGHEVDITDQIQIVDEGFFRNENGEPVEWWNKIPDGAFAIIDEIQMYMPTSAKDEGGKAYVIKFMQFVAKHRHRGIDIWVMSQSLKNVHVEVRRQLATCLSVVNVKNMKIGVWPLSVPMSDFDVVREAWGCKRQMAHIKRGVFEDDKLILDKDREIFVLRPSLFNLYRSHTLSDKTSDRPSLNLSKIGSVFWLLRRHGLRLGICTGMIILCLVLAVRTLFKLPTVISSSLVGGFAVSAPVSEKPKTATVTEPGTDVANVVVLHPQDDAIIGLLRDGVITPKGVLRLEEHLIFEGEKDYIKAVDVRKRCVFLGSGKKVQK